MTHGEHKHELPHLDTWGQAGHLTQEQQDALAQFISFPDTVPLLEKVKFRVETQENVALRFLRARQFHADQALQLLKECHTKREDSRATHYASISPDECAQCDVHVMKKWYPHGDLGYDKFNRPVMFEYSGLVDAHAIYQMTTLERCINYHWWTMEHTLNDLFEKAAQRGPSIISTCVLVDLTGLNSHHASSLVLNHLKAMVAVDNVCYPETLGKMIVVNAPWLATSLWEMCKGWLDIRTQEKIEILGSGPDVHKRLLEFIDAEYLPKRFGGHAADPDFVRDNAEFLWINRHSSIKKTVTIGRKQKLVLDFYVTDGDVHFEAFSQQGQQQTETPVTVFSAITEHHIPLHEVVGYSDVSRIATNDHLHSLQSQEVKGVESKTPIRTVLEFVNDSEDATKTFVFFFGNASRWTQRPLTYVVNIRDL